MAGRTPTPRTFYTSSSCGVCGKGALEAVAVEAPRVDSDLHVSAALVSTELPDKLRAAHVRTLLDLARVAAHDTGERTNAPLLCYLLGLAVARSDEGLEAISEGLVRTSPADA